MIARRHLVGLILTAVLAVAAACQADRRDQGHTGSSQGQSTDLWRPASAERLYEYPK
ncbi:hypothetical protein [Streptomyces sp. NPDC003393]|jgi:hypothetical protein